MNRNITILASAGALALALASIGSYAGGVFQTLPILGGPSYCASTVSGATGLSGTTGTGQATGGSICGETVPAGPAVFAGTEVTNADIYTPGTTTSNGGAQTAVVSLLDFGAGPMIDLTTVATTQTIPSYTPYYFLDGAQGSALTVTMPPTVTASASAPASPVEGQIQRIICEASTVGTLTVAANTGQTLKGNPNAACVAGVGYAWRWQASNTTWYRVQ
jgi:hypothetical protein